MRGEPYPRPPRVPRVVEGRVLTLLWPDGRRVVMDYLGQGSCSSAPGRLGRLMHVFKVKVEDTGLRRRWDADHAVPLSEPYTPPPKKRGKR